MEQITRMPTTTAAKVDAIEQIATELGWTNLAAHEAMIEQVNRMWNQSVVTDALRELVDENRAAKGLGPVAECTRRIAFCDPQYDRINFHVELLDGKVKSAALDYFGKTKESSLTGIIRHLVAEQEMNRIRESLS